MFFADYARSCVWALGKKADGEPDPTAIQTFVEAAETPVDLLTGPGGDLYYVDYGLDDEWGVGDGEAGVHRIVYTGNNAAPTAQITANQLSGPAPLTVNFSGTSSTDPDGDALTYAWDLDGNGSFEATGATQSKTYARRHLHGEPQGGRRPRDTTTRRRCRSSPATRRRPWAP